MNFKYKARGCISRRMIDSLHIIWCDKYHQIVGEQEPQLCRGCQNVDKVREMFEEQSKKFDGCMSIGIKSGYCIPFSCKTNKKYCELCSSSPETRASLALDNHIRKNKENTLRREVDIRNLVRRLEVALSKLEASLGPGQLLKAGPDLQTIKKLKDYYLSQFGARVRNG